jgi:ABC-2 type transport system permease protein
MQDALTPLAVHASRSGAAEPAIARSALRRTWVAATAWALVFGGSAAASAVTYAGTYPTSAERQAIASTTGRDSGFAVLLGPVADIGTVGGYTVYKNFVFLTTIGAIWALLAATRLLRGEEDAGRRQMLLSGRTTPVRATAATLAGLMAAVGIVFTGAVAVLLLAGRDSRLEFGTGSTLLYGLSLVINPVLFAAIGAFTSQLAATRRGAAGMGFGAFAVLFVLRMLGDSGPHMHWLLWLTPFGWSELLRPFTRDALLPLLPSAAAALALTAAAIGLSARRDTGAGLLASRDTAPPRLSGLGSPTALAARLELPTLAVWCAGAGAAALSLGSLAKVVTDTSTRSLANALDKFTPQGALVDRYLSVAFLFVAAIVALIPAGQLAAMAAEETSGRTAHVLAGPASRISVLVGRLALTGAAITTAGLLSGVGAWLGAAMRGTDVGFGSMVATGLNLVPTSLLVLGIGACVLALAPRAAGVAVYAAVIGSLLADMLGSLEPGTHWLRKASFFHYMASAPTESPDALTVVITVALAGALCALACVLFQRRDLQLS